jgi:hypothetical protein
MQSQTVLSAADNAQHMLTGAIGKLREMFAVGRKEIEDQREKARIVREWMVLADKVERLSFCTFMGLCLGSVVMVWRHLDWY